MPLSPKELEELVRKEKEKYPHIIPGSRLYARYKGSPKPYSVLIMSEIRYRRVADCTEPDWDEIKRRFSQLVWSVKLDSSKLELDFIGLPRFTKYPEKFTFRRDLALSLSQDNIRKVFVNEAGEPLLDPAEGIFTPCVEVLYTSRENGLVHPGSLYRTYAEAEAVAPLRIKNQPGIVRMPIEQKK